MLPADAKIYCGNTSVNVKDVREDHHIVASAGWGETSDTFVKDVYLNDVNTVPMLRITTARGTVLRCTPDQLCFGRFNPSLRMYSLYLHERSTLGFRVGLASDIIHEAIYMMTIGQNMSGRRNVTDKIWVIENNPNLTNATFMHKYVMAKYGLPDIPFSSKHKDSVLTDEHIRRLFDGIDTPMGAREFLRDSNMFIEHPHLTVKLADGEQVGSNSIQFVIFGGKDKTSTGHYSHLIQIQGIADPNATMAEQFRAMKRQRNNRGLWYLEVTRDDLDEAELFVKTVSNLDDLEIVKKIQLTKKASYYVLPASHLKRGMLVPILNQHGCIDEDVVNKVEVYDYDGPLYDLQVVDLHNYIADNCVLMCYMQNSNPSRIKSLV